MSSSPSEQAPPPPTPEGASFISRVGSRIRSLRQDRGMTVGELAESARLSRRMLTQVELGQANPSLATIDKIASALGSDFASLSLPDTTDGLGTVPPTVAWSSAAGSEAQLLGASTTPRAELWKWTLAPDDHYDAAPDRKGAEEVIHVIAGQLLIRRTGGDLVLEPGMTGHISSDQKYSYSSSSTTSTVFFRVVTGA